MALWIAPNIEVYEYDPPVTPPAPLAQADAGRGGYSQRDRQIMHRLGGDKAVCTAGASRIAVAAVKGIIAPYQRDSSQSIPA